MRSLYITGTIVLIVLAILPFLFVSKYRTVKTHTPRIHPILDMDNQPRYKPQSFSTFYTDNRSMRPRVAGTLAYGDVQDEIFLTGKISEEEFTTEFPEEVTLNKEFLARGENRYNIFCATCHGYSGYSDGIISQRATSLMEGTWTPPTSFHNQATRDLPVGHLYNVINNGIRKMPAYGHQIETMDRWAVVAYVKALMKSQYTNAEQLSDEEIEQLNQQQ